MKVKAQQKNRYIAKNKLKTAKEFSVEVNDATVHDLAVLMDSAALLMDFIVSRSQPIPNRREESEARIQLNGVSRSTVMQDVQPIVMPFSGARCVCRERLVPTVTSVLVRAQKSTGSPVNQSVS